MLLRTTRAAETSTAATTAALASATPSATPLAPSPLFLTHLLELLLLLGSQNLLHSRLASFAQFPHLGASIFLREGFIIPNRLELFALLLVYVTELLPLLVAEAQFLGHPASASRSAVSRATAATLTLLLPQPPEFFLLFGS